MIQIHDLWFVISWFIIFKIQIDLMDQWYIPELWTDMYYENENWKHMRKKNIT